MKEAEVILARSAGFCFGVHRAVDTVYERTGMENVYTYGPIIHNDEVVKDLESKGVKAISDVAQLDGIDNATVIIRSHGVSKNVYESIKTKNYEVVDATCPFVLKIHRIVEQESKAGKQIVIIGNEKHPEVEGIKGWSVSPVYIVDSIEKAQNLELDRAKEVVVVFQSLERRHISVLFHPHQVRQLRLLRSQSSQIMRRVSSIQSQTLRLHLMLQS